MVTITTKRKVVSHHYRTVVYEDGLKIGSSKWHGDKFKDANLVLERVAKKQDRLVPFALVTKEVTINKSNEFKYHYKVYIPTNTGGFNATIVSRRKLTTQEINKRVEKWQGKYSEVFQWEKIDVTSCIIYTGGVSVES